ncbi:hypothetical protein SGPA1_40102 [Streptomyces misionensis JCM 4497]
MVSYCGPTAVVASGRRRAALFGLAADDGAANPPMLTTSSNAGSNRTIALRLFIYRSLPPDHRA